ncbi:MAG: GNAT family N-acetyltransferase [Lachnospiraceae bacterium]|nr:GNAT family N-acetyltransferase [Lachnospiraceae bacterium]
MEKRYGAHRLYLIGGTMGVGKTTVCKCLKEMLNGSVFLDGDWCWDMHPFQVTPETKRMVLENIVFLLNSFLGCTACEHVIFCWVLHEQSIINEILSRLELSGCEVHVISLVCGEEELRARIRKDVDAGVRTEEAVAESLKRLPFYSGLRTVKIDVSALSPEQTAKQIAKLGNRDVVIGKARPRDWEAMYRNVWSRPETARYMAWQVTKDEEAARARMRRTVAYEKTHDTYLVYERKSGQAIGFAGVEEIRPHVFQETGIALGPEYVGKGYGKQVLQILLERSILLGGREFYYSTRKGNVAGKALALSCGFVYRNSGRKTDQQSGEVYELEIYKKRLKNL